MPLSTHVLDTSTGRPARGIAVTTAVRKGDAWVVVGRTATDAAGRVADVLDGEPLEAATYRITFATGAYLGPDAFYPEVVVTIRVTAPDEHHHIPLLLAPHGYTTYRGS
jgi:5-hydroxyisourate hydrolase